MNLIQAIIDKEYNPTVVGLDPRPDLLPADILERAQKKYGSGLRALAEATYEFNCGILDAVADVVPAVKPQSAFYELLGHHGVAVLERTVKYAKKLGLYVIMDAKRGDIGSTAEAYSAAYLGKTDVFGKKCRAFTPDALTVNAYLGSDGVRPFLADCKNGRMIFALVKTSNPSSGELQDRLVDGEPVWRRMAELTNEWSKGLRKSHGYHALGIVAGATYPKELSEIRKLLPHSIFLVPGYGAQGGTAADIVGAFDRDGLGAIVNSSRGIVFAYKKTGEDYKTAARNAAIYMKEDLLSALAAR
ncbi:MAG: orotidine-5'-phosphate decarboxylase [Clostridia bacterium]|nr:orotidine-5'-phosphate decarboxylase [Clostridia bacterium]